MHLTKDVPPILMEVLTHQKAAPLISKGAKDRNKPQKEKRNCQGGPPLLAG